MTKEKLLLIASIVFSLLIGEVVLAKFFPQRTNNQYRTDRPAMYVADRVLGTDLQPGYRGYLKEEEFRHNVEISSLGLRQDEFEIAKHDRTRILFVGDSFTFGYGVEGEDGYVPVAERELNGSGEGNYQTIAKGVPAWWTDSYYLYLKTRGLALEPDVVVIGLFVGNDIDVGDPDSAVWSDVDANGLPLATMSKRVRIDQGHRVKVERKVRWKVPVLRNSHVFQLCWTSVQRVLRMFKPKVRGVIMYQHGYSENTEIMIKKVEQMLLGMAAGSRDAGAQFAVVMIPERFQVHSQYRTDQNLDYDKPQRLFGEFFTRNGIQYLDLLPILRAQAESNDELLYYRKDSHFTRLGYQVSGEAIANFLKSSGLLTAARDGRDADRDSLNPHH